MDHYPYPAEPIYPRVKVPYLLSPDSTGYDGDCKQDFSAFPAQNGWKKAEFLDGKLQAGNPETASAFLQEWLFFGLVSAVLDLSPKGREQLIVRNEKGQAVSISTEALPKLINDWMEIVVDYNTVNAQAVVKAVSMCLDEASVFCLAASADLDGYRLEKDHPEVRLSIMALGDQLQSALRTLEIKLNTVKNRLAAKTRDYFGEKSFMGKAASKMSKVKSLKESILKPLWETPYATAVEKSPLYWADLLDDVLYYAEDKERPSFLGPWPWGTSITLRNRLHEAKWCEYEAARIQDILSPWAVHYVSAMFRPPLFDHSECRQSHCNAHTIDEKTYKTQHVKEGCECAFIGVPREDVNQILKDGSFPIVRILVDSETDTAKMEVVDRKKKPTIASLWPLSHVWSHGLGNARDNTIPTCQAIRLSEISGKVGNEVYVWLWIDTICVPLEKRFRQMAITKMSQVYSGDSGTVVIDKELTKTACKEMSFEEVLMRVACSSWAQRMWTLQEGARDRVSLVFADGVMDLTATMRHYHLHNTLTPIARGGFAFDMMYQMTKAREESDADSDTQIMRIWNSMRWRQATKSGDEAIILASLLYPRASNSVFSFPSDKLHVETFDQILWTHPDQRWSALFRTRKTWPQGILFVNCKTIPERGLRWAPSEIGTYGREIPDSIPGHVTHRGLKIKRPGYVFHPIRTALTRDAFEFHDVQTGDWYAVSLMEQTHVEAWPAPGDMAFAIVQSKRLAGYAKIPAVMGRVEEIEDEVIPMEFACKVFVSKVFQERKEELDALVAADPDRRFGAAQIYATAMKEEQLWCVG